MTSTIEEQLQEINESLTDNRCFQAVAQLEEILEKEELSQEERIKVMISLCWGYLYIIQWRYHIEFPDMKYAKKYQKITDRLLKESTELGKISYIFDSYWFETFTFFYTTDYQKLDKDMEQLTLCFEEIKERYPEVRKEKEALHHMVCGYYPTWATYGGKQIEDDVIEKSRRHCQKALELKEQSSNQFIVEFGSYNLLQNFHLKEGNMEKYFEAIKQCIDLAEKYGNDNAKAFFYGSFLGYYQVKGDNTKVLEYLIKRKELWDRLELEGRDAAHNHDMGIFYWTEGDRDKALENFLDSLDYFENQKSEAKVARIQSSIGAIYLSKGDLNEALKYTEKAYNFLTTNKIEGWWTILGNMASVLLMKGELEKAKKIHEERLAFYENEQRRHMISDSLMDLSIVLWQLGEMEQSLEYAHRSYDLAKEIDMEIWKGYLLYYLIFFLQESGDYKSAAKYFEDLKLMNSNLNDRLLDLFCSYLEARFLAQSKEQKDKLRSQFLLEELLKKELNYVLRVRVVISLTELLLSNLYDTNDKSILYEIQKHVLNLFSLASSNQSYILIVESLLLQSKLALLELDVEKAKQHLDQASKLAKEKGLGRLQKTIEEEKAKFETELSQIKKFDEDEPFSKRLDVLQINKRMNGIKKSSGTQDQITTTEMSQKLFSIKI